MDTRRIQTCICKIQHDILNYDRGALSETEGLQKMSPNETKLQSQLQPVSLQHQLPLQVKRTIPRNTR